MKLKRICAGVYETQLPVNLRWESDGFVAFGMATVTVESMRGEWSGGGWNMRIEVRNPRLPDATIELTNCDEVYSTKSEAVESLDSGILKNWTKGRLGWVIS